MTPHAGTRPEVADRGGEDRAAQPTPVTPTTIGLFAQ